MVSFSCELCNDTIIKRKLDQHKQRCSNAFFTCIDCSTTFSGSDYRQHTQCISEAEKYEKSLYKGKKAKQTAPEEALKRKIETSVESRKTEKKLKKDTFDLSQISSGSLYRVVKSLSNISKIGKKDVMKKVQVKRVKGELTLTL